MPPVAVVTDTTAYLPADVVDEHGIVVVPLYVVFGSDRTVKESEITDYPAFFEELRSAESLPTTSQPSVGDFIAAYEPLLAQGRDVVSIHISAGHLRHVRLRPPGGRAARARGQGRRARPRDRLHHRRRAAWGCWCWRRPPPPRAGGDLDEVEARVRQARDELKIWFAVDTLEFLKRGGRIGAASAWIGSTLKIKPILIVESELTPVERVRTSARAVRAAGRLRPPAPRVRRGRLGGAAHRRPEQAEELVERCREIFGCDPVFVGEIGPVLSAHVGPGLLGVGSIPAQYLE